MKLALIINADNLIIEGEPGKFISSGIQVKWNGCVIRNLWVKSIECEFDVTVVDSVITIFYASKDSRAEIFFNNCRIGAIAVYSNNKTVVLYQCAISNGNISLWLLGSKIEIEKCIIYSAGNAFIIPENKVKIDIKDSIVFADGNLMIGDNKTNAAKTVGDIKKSKILCDVSPKNVIEQKPLFEQEEPTCSIVYDQGRGKIFLSLTKRVELKDFVLKAASPDKEQGWGAKLSNNNFPSQ